MAANEPSRCHRVSAHTTPHDTRATVHQYPIGIRICPSQSPARWCCSANSTAAPRVEQPILA
jgi:hypothetical protein